MDYGMIAITVIGIFVTIVLALISALWFILWQVIESLRIDVSTLRETVIKLGEAIAGMRPLIKS